MPKRLAAAPLALLTFAAVLVVAAPPAAAHDLYHYASQQKQRCAYDPFAGNQCWTETVSVRVPSHHSHAQVCPPGTTGTHPDCYPTPPTNDPVTDTPDNDWTDPEPDPVEPDTTQPDTSDPDPVDPDPVDPDPVDPDPVDPDPVDPDPVEAGTGTGTTADPCDAWHDKAVKVLLGPPNSDGLHVVDPVPSGCTTGAQRFTGWVKTHGDAAAKKLRKLFETAMQAQADSADGEIQASAELRKALKDILGNEYVQAAGAAVTCGVLVDALIKSRGRVAKVPGWQKAVKHSSTGGCGAAVLYVENLLGKIPCVSVGSDGVNTGPRTPGDPLWCPDDDTPSGEGSGSGWSGDDDGSEDVDPPSSQEDVDNARDRGGAPSVAYARKMCAAYPHLDFFCSKVPDSEQEDGQ